MLAPGEDHATLAVAPALEGLRGGGAVALRARLGLLALEQGGGDRDGGHVVRKVWRVGHWGGRRERVISRAWPANPGITTLNLSRNLVPGTPSESQMPSRPPAPLPSRWRCPRHAVRASVPLPCHPRPSSSSQRGGGRWDSTGGNPAGFADPCSSNARDPTGSPLSITPFHAKCHLSGINRNSAYGRASGR